MSESPTFTISMFPSSKGEPYFDLGLTLLGKPRSHAGEIKIPFPLKIAPFIQTMLNIRQKYDRMPAQSDEFICPPDDVLTILQNLNLLNNTRIVEDVHIIIGKLIGDLLLGNEDFEQCLLLFYDEAKKMRRGNIIFEFDQRVLELAVLPWELAYYQSEPLLLHLGPDTLLGCARIIVNQLQMLMGPAIAAALPTHSKIYSETDTLRILVAVSHAGMKEDDVHFEKEAHKYARVVLEKKFIGIKLDFEPLDQVKIHDLEMYLSQEPFANILEYYGHGQMENEHATLRMGSAERGIEAISSTRLKSLKNLPPLIVFHACNSAQLNLKDIHASLTISLIEAGVQAVIAMQFQIRMRDVTKYVVPTFYEGLANGLSLLQIVAEIRRKLYVEVGGKVSWYVPVLYMREFNSLPYLRKLQAPLPINPFTRGIIKGPEVFEFVGCTKQVQQVWSCLESGGNLSITGQSGSGKTALLTLISQKSSVRLSSDIQAIRLNIEPEWKKIDDVKQALAQKLGGSKSSLVQLLQGKHIILLLDNINTLPQNSKIPAWLRGLSEDRSDNTIQLVVTSSQPLHTLFLGSNQPLHKAIDTIIELEPFSREDVVAFISTRLRGTGLTFEIFDELLSQHLQNTSQDKMLPGNLEDICKKLYDKLSKSFSRRIEILYS